MALAKAPLIHSGCGNDLFEFPAVINLCKLFITSDTLGLHIALALKRRTIALFGPTSANEIEMYGLGKKIISKSKCYCCYKKDCGAMQWIRVDEIIKEARNLIKEKISIVVTSFKEPNLDLAIKSILNQKINYNYEIIVVAPDKEAELLVRDYSKKYNIKYFKDPGKGKSYALNLLLGKIKGNLIILTDGDVIVGYNSINEIIDAFKNPLIGIATGRVISSNKKTNKLGYWSHLLADAGAHRIRKKLFLQNKFLECSGYLFAFRNGIIKQFPLDVAEDTIIPYMFYIKNYKIGYAEKAIVYVKNPDNVKDWIKQRKRTAKAHETLTKYYPNFPRVKSFLNEIKFGVFAALGYPMNAREMYWTVQLFFVRAYMWFLTLAESKLLKKQYQDAWEKIHSTK